MAQQQAKKSFFLGRGTGRQIMTEQKWQEHWKKMRSISPEEGHEYREEWHQKMVEGAHERGITMPETPGPHGPGKGMALVTVWGVAAAEDEAASTSDPHIKSGRGDQTPSQGGHAWEGALLRDAS